MKKQLIFEGVGTALVTPFSRGEIDYPALRGLIEMQIANGIDALVIGGTTGEAATLSDAERYDLFRFAKEAVSGRTKIIFGTGTNDTRVAMCHTEFASRLGCDGVLLVTPYYNKGTKEGIVRHYLSVAEVSDVPILLYNVPSRTGVNLDMETLEKLALCEKIVGIKEASDSTDRLVSLASFGEDLWLYSGNDSQIYPTLAVGGRGVISVVSNLYPRETMEICKLFFAKRMSESLALQRKMLPLILALFLETNPAPIKFALSERGLCAPDMRLPMWFLTESSKRRLSLAIQKFEEG